MSISIRKLNNHSIIDIYIDKLDLFSVKVLRNTLKDLINSNNINILVNFGMIKSLDSSVLGCLVLAQKKCLNKGGELSIFALDSEILSIFYIIQLDKYISIFNSELDALNHKNSMVKRRFKII
ncbi:MAG: STAS domain-containing protein [Candidatus Gastranaerophilales bacterium]|nr:STAS domain-containing protein [Candidatus Gastranaerophilales bacterium]